MLDDPEAETDPNPNPNPKGIEKLWIWDNVAMSKISWDFFIHDFPPSFVSKELQSIQTKYLKKWSGLADRADPSLQFVLTLLCCTGLAKIQEWA